MQSLALNFLRTDRRGLSEALLYLFQLSSSLYVFSALCSPWPLSEAFSTVPEAGTLEETVQGAAVGHPMETHASYTKQGQVHALTAAPQKTKRPEDGAPPDGQRLHSWASHGIHLTRNLSSRPQRMPALEWP